GVGEVVGGGVGRVANLDHDRVDPAQVPLGGGGRGDLEVAEELERAVRLDDVLLRIDRVEDQLPLRMDLVRARLARAELVDGGDLLLGLDRLEVHFEACFDLHWIVAAPGAGAAARTRSPAAARSASAAPPRP